MSVSNSKNTNIFFNSWLQETDPYAAGLSFEQVSEKYGFKYEEILRLAGNESTIGTSPKAIAAAKLAVENSNFYDEPKAESLISALETEFINAGVDMTELGFVAGSGMDSILEHSIQFFTQAGDSIINYSPSFIYYDFAATRHGLEIIEIPRAIMASDASVIASEAKQSNSTENLFSQTQEKIQSNTKLIFLCSPNNPDGSITTLEEIKKIAKLCLEKDIVLFIDHAYVEFTDREAFDARSIIKDFPNMIIGYTFSKSYAMAGFRVGYALMHKSLQEKFLALMTPFLISKASIAAALAALEDKEHLAKILHNNKNQKPKLKSALEELKLKVLDSEANFLLFSTENIKLNAEDFMQALLAKGIIIRAMKQVGRGWFRVTIGREFENKRFIEAIKEILS